MIRPGDIDLALLSFRKRERYTFMANEKILFDFRFGKN